MNTFNGINNKINIRVEDVEEKSNKKYDSVNDNTVVSNHTILSEYNKVISKLGCADKSTLRACLVE